MFLFQFFMQCFYQTNSLTYQSSAPFGQHPHLPFKWLNTLRYQAVWLEIVCHCKYDILQIIQYICKLKINFENIIKYTKIISNHYPYYEILFIEPKKSWFILMLSWWTCDSFVLSTLEQHVWDNLLRVTISIQQRDVWVILERRRIY